KSRMSHLAFYPYLFLLASTPPPLYPLPLHDALPISGRLPPALSPENPAAFAVAAGIGQPAAHAALLSFLRALSRRQWVRHAATRSEEHTSELQSRENLVCRIPLEIRLTIPFRLLLSI